MITEIYVDLDGQELIKKTWDYGSIYYTIKQGQLHRLGGPAYIGSNGTEKYYLEGERVSKRDIDLLWLRKQVE